MASLKIQVVNKKLIKPSKPTPYHLRKFKLSLFDQLAASIYGNMLFYYLPSEGGNYKVMAAQRSARLEKSLSEVLTIFYPLAGRYIETDVSISCCDQGVEFIEAKVVNKTLVEFLQDGSALDLQNKLLPWDRDDALPPSNPEANPQLGVQINSFDCEGLVIGISISHLIADAWTFVRFVNEWAAINRAGRVLSPAAATTSNSGYYFASMFPVLTTSLAAALRPILPAPEKSDHKFVKKRFLFDETTLAKIRNRAAAVTSLLGNHRSPSKVLLLQAFLWKLLIDVALAKHGHPRSSVFAVPLNLRGKIGNLPTADPQPPCGNFIMPVVVQFLPEKYEGKILDLNDLILLIRDTIQRKRAQLENAATTADDVSTMTIEARREFNEKRYFSYAGRLDYYVCSSICGFPKYESDFGWGRPYWVSDACGNLDRIALMDSKNGDGIEAWIRLKEEDMGLLEQLLHKTIPSPSMSKL